MPACQCTLKRGGQSKNFSCRCVLWLVYPGLQVGCRPGFLFDKNICCARIIRNVQTLIHMAILFLLLTLFCIIFYKDFVTGMYIFSSPVKCQPCMGCVMICDHPYPTGFI